MSSFPSMLSGWAGPPGPWGNDLLSNYGSLAISLAMPEIFEEKRQL